MKTLRVRNVHDALPRAVHILRDYGLERDSRNGKVLQAPWPVTTVYDQPCERVLFWPERDANPFFHLYEALWMLAGRNDVAGPARYAKNIANYSDDGVTLHGAYGHRWRKQFPIWSSTTHDQLRVIAEQLKNNQDDRRSVLQMWDGMQDLGRQGKDLPCNLTVTFQRDPLGALDMVVFCRSNDIVWGAYGANAVHFSMLLEYMALWIGCKVGTYTQISVNWHGYLTSLEPIKHYRPDKANFVDNPYTDGRVIACPMTGSIQDLDSQIQQLLRMADSGDYTEHFHPSPWVDVVWRMFRAHHIWTTTSKLDRFAWAMLPLTQTDLHNVDWLVAGREWLIRRHEAKTDGNPIEA